VIAISDWRAQWKSFFEAVKIFIGQTNMQGSEILFEITGVLRSRNGDDVLPLGENPGKSQLRRRTVDFLSHLSYSLGQMQIAPEIISLEPGMMTAPVVLWNVIRRLESPSEKATSQWAVSNKAGAQLPACTQDFAFRIP
jgi:hypothetical protein